MSEIPLQSTNSAQTLPEITWKRPVTWPFPGRVIVAAALSALIPGTGHVLIGERRKGLLLLAATLVSVLAVVAVVPREPFAALAMLTQPRNLAGLLVADVALLLFRGYAVIDVVRSGRKRADNHPGMLVVLALLLAFTAAPHVAVAYYDIVTYQFLENVFDGGNAFRREAVAPAQVQTTLEIRLADGVNAAAPPVVAPTGVPDDPSVP
ncbi:MAG: hypothetical protein AB7V46_20545 [Thermomicrobiales bacterium]